MHANPPPTVLPAFFKGHGLGNDYLVMEEVSATTADAGDVAGRDADARDAEDQGAGARSRPAERDTVPLDGAAIRGICDRWRGVGGDGIVVLLEGDREPWRLRMFNPDGSEFERSGNGLRVLAAYLSKTGRVGREPFRVEVGGAEVGMTVHSTSASGRYDVSVEMGEARFGAAAVGLSADPDDPRLVHSTLGRPDFEPVSVGNPHAVVFMAGEAAHRTGEGLGTNIDRLVEEVGPFLSTNPAFAAGTNVQVVRSLEPGVVEIRIWERGVGPTSASGTSACAAAAAAVRRGLQRPGPIRVEAPGGALSVEVEEGWGVTLRGPVEAISTGRLDPGFVRALGA